jgi:four helix bundle protein
MKYNLENRLVLFSKESIKICKTININIINKSIVHQFIRSSNSIGANYHEANNACSKKDFVNKLYISLKEANETRYWLQLLCTSNPEKITQFKNLNNECQQIIKIIQSIINKSK